VAFRDCRRDHCWPVASVTAAQRFGCYRGDTVAKVKSCRATDFSRNYETGSNCRFV
jgi:hypothetical protein